MRSTVEGGGGEVVVLAEPSRGVLAKVELGEDGEEHGGEDGRVDADREVAEAPADNGGDEGVEAHLGPEAVHEVEGNGDEET